MQGERRQCLQFDTESICPDVIKSVYNVSIVLRFFLHQCARSPILMKDNFRGDEWSFKKLWVSQNFRRILRVSQSRFFSGYVRLAVSIFFHEAVSGSRFLPRL